ncbi:hypothetical protein ACSAZL_15910 [Methanosarcina sp. T3]|uniref:hypothetical protein n=1 Tax=Methanosarcina sp. T3 TaxID=3439062 RepID=UPI003F862FE5
MELLHRLILDPKCEIKSPDYLIDKITGQPREVDISIKYDFGYIPIVIIVECRDRNNKEDVTWIEQLVMKCANLNVNKVVAVSSTGFTQPAMTSAQHYGIITHTINEISLGDVKSWFMCSSLEGYHKYFNIINASIGLSGYNTKNFEIKCDRKIFSFEDKCYSFNDIFHIEALEKNPQIYNDIEANGLKKIKKFNLKISKKYSIIAPDCVEYYLESFAGECELWIEYLNIPFSKIFRFGDDSHTLIEGVSTEGFKIGNCTYKVSFFKTKHGINVRMEEIDKDKTNV